MKKALKIIWLFSGMAIRTTLQHRTGVLFFIFGKLVRFAVFFVFVFHLLSNTKLLAGYDLSQTVVFYLTFNVIDTISQMLFREVYRFRSMVVSGELDTVLVKPYHPLLRVLLGGIDILDLFILPIYIGILWWFAHTSGLVNGWGIAAYVLLVGNALVMSAGFHIAVLGFGILSSEVDHTVMMYRDITRLGTLPMDIYREPLRSFITFVIPIGVMLSFPAKALFSLLAPQFIIISLLFGVGLLGGSLWFWEFALRRYQSGSS